MLQRSKNELPSDEEQLNVKHKMPIDYKPINGVPKRGEIAISHLKRTFAHLPPNIIPKKNQ